MVKSKLILRSSWRLNLDWDTEIPQHMQSKLTSMAEELAGLNRFYFARRSFSRTRPTKLCVFCDASHQTYGFVIYGVQDGISQIIFAKTKVAPVKSKSLPTLELLAVFLVFKASHFEVRSYSDAVIADFYNSNWGQKSKTRVSYWWRCISLFAHAFSVKKQAIHSPTIHSSTYRLSSTYNLQHENWNKINALINVPKRKRTTKVMI